MLKNQFNYGMKKNQALLKKKNKSKNALGILFFEQ